MGEHPEKRNGESERKMGIEFIIAIVCSFLLINGLSKLIQNPRQQSNFQILCCFVVLFVFFCFRDLPILNDTSHYYRTQAILAAKSPDLIHVFDKYNPNDHYEYLFQCWTRFIAKYVWRDGYAIIFITSLLVTIANLWFLKKYTPRHIALAVFMLFMYLLFMNSANRQAYAIMLFYIAFKYLQENKTLHYLIIIGIAYFFHSSANILFLLPLLRYFQFKASNIRWMFIIAAIIAFCMYPLMGSIGFEDDYYVTHNALRERLPLAQILNFIFSAGMLGCIWYIRKSYHFKYPDTWVSWCSVLCVAWELIAIPLLVFARYASYFQIFVIIELFYMIYHCENRTGTTISGSRNRIPRHWILGIFIIAILARIIMVMAMRNEWFHMVPYDFYDFKPGYHNSHFGY